MKTKRCEGWIRTGGIFTFGPVTWAQCANDGIVMLKFKEGKKIKILPACKECWAKCLATGIKIIKAQKL